MKKFYASFLVLSILFLNSGCATIVGGGGSQEVDIQSEPSGAELFVDGANYGKTPVSATLERRDTHQLKFKKDGYSEEILMTKKKMNPWLWGNLLVGGIIGILIDMSTGAANKIDPSNVYVVMTKTKPVETPVVVPQAETQPVVQPVVISKPTEIDQIEKLGQLKEKGLITQAEFDKKKSELLGLSAEASQVVKLPAQDLTQSQSQTPSVSDTIVEAGQKADLSAVSGTSTTTASQDNAPEALKTASQTTVSPVPAPAQ